MTFFKEKARCYESTCSSKDFNKLILHNNIYSEAYAMHFFFFRIESDFKSVDGFIQSVVDLTPTAINKD